MKSGGYGRDGGHTAPRLRQAPPLDSIRFPGRLEFVNLQCRELRGAAFRLDSQRNIAGLRDKRHRDVGQAVAGERFQTRAVAENRQPLAAASEWGRGTMPVHSLTCWVERVIHFLRSMTS